MTRTLLMLTRYDRMGASSRVRSLQYLPYLEAGGITPIIAPLFPAEYLAAQYSGGRRGWMVARALTHRIKDLLQIRRPDAIWLEYEALPWMPFGAEQTLLPRHIPLIADYDDAIFHRYDRHRYKVVRQLLGTKIDKVMARADLVLAGNPYLAARARDAGASDVMNLPTVLNMDQYHPNARPGDGPVQVGWVGSPSTWDQFMAPMLDVLDPVMKDAAARLLVVGAKGRHAHHPWVQLQDWSEETEVHDLQQMDIGLMPLTDDPWARGKCGYKLIQYMACGLPVIASPVGVNSDIVQHGVTGFLATTPAQWTDALTQLITNPALRARMGTAARQRVERDYAVAHHGPRLVDALTGVMG